VLNLLIKKDQNTGESLMKLYHGLNYAPEYYDFSICKRVLVPFNLIYRKKIKQSYLLTLKNNVEELIIDSGAAYYFLNSDKKYPPDYLESYLSFLIKFKPTFAFALDFCFEREKFRTRKMLEENFFSQEQIILLARENGFQDVFPVVQGWDRDSYILSAKNVKLLMEKYSLRLFGIGSICRAPKNRIKEVLSWIKTVLDLGRAHGFGQTQRTISILKKFGLYSLDTSNAVSNAGYNIYCDPFGNWFYSLSGKQGKNKHRLEYKTFESRKAWYNYLFKLNVESLEMAVSGIPDGWVHPITNQKQLFI